MYFIKSFVVLVAAAALASAMHGVNRRAEGGFLDSRGVNNCQNYIGNCFQNGCAAMFSNASDIIGTCRAGTYYGCPCYKCGNDIGYVGSCSENGCDGSQDTCTAGTYEGCPCD